MGEYTKWCLAKELHEGRKYATVTPHWNQNNTLADFFPVWNIPIVYKTDFFAEPPSSDPDGQSLGPEVCFCMKVVFKGKDGIDGLSWDLEWKGSRAFWLSSRPVLALLDRFPASYNTLQPFEDKALAKGSGSPSPDDQSHCQNGIVLE